MLSDAFEKWLKKSQKKKGIAIGMKIGIEKGKDIGKGITIGIKQERSRWRAWNMRRELAQSEGREFNEPPPDGLDNR